MPLQADVSKRKPLFAPLTLAEARAKFAELGAAGFAASIAARAAADPTNAVIAADFQPGSFRSGRLSGLPIGVKDNIDALPFPTTGGCPGLSAFMPAADAPPVARLREAGAWIPCKLNLHELAFGVTSNNAAFGPVRNPFDLDRVAGGSSGGSATAVATGLVCAALGTDTGGSVRIPAAFSNVVGFRPSTGRYDDGGVLTLSRTRDTIGILASSVGDVAEVDAIITASDHEPSLPDRPIRLGLPGDALAGISAAVDEGFRAALARLVEQGVVECVDLPPIGYEACDLAIGGPIVFNEALDVWTEFCRQRLSMDLASFAETISSPDVAGIFRAMPAIAAETAALFHAAAPIGRNSLQARYGALFSLYDIDLVVAPTVPVQPPLIGEDDTMLVEGRQHAVFPTITRNCAMATLTGSPSLAMPLGLDRDWFPLSMMLEGPIGSDRRLLTLGLRLETALRNAGFSYRPVTD